MAAPNIVAVTTITGKTGVLVVSNSATAIATNTVSSGKVFKVNALYISNIDGTSAADVNIDLFRSNVAYRIAQTISVPADATLDIISKSIYLEEGDALRITANVNTRLEAVCSYEEIS